MRNTHTHTKCKGEIKISWPVSDSILTAIEGGKAWTEIRINKLQDFWGPTIADIKRYRITFLRKNSHFIIVETDTNDVANKTPNELLDELLPSKNDIKKGLLNFEMVFQANYSNE